MTDIGFWTAVLGVPVTALAVNVLVRRFFKLPQSALADLMLVIVVFDALVIIQHDDFVKFVRIIPLKNSIIATYVPLLIIDMAAWFLFVSKLETNMVKIEGVNTVSANVSWLLWQFVSGLLALVVVISSMAPFAYKGNAG